MPFEPPDFPSEPGPLQERLAPERILRRLGAVPELAMQAAIWRECFEHLTPAQLVIIIDTVRRALVRGDIAGRAGWLSLVRVVEQIRGGPKGLGLFLAAKAAEDEALQALLLDSAPARALDADAHRPPRLNTDREITLGERRSWARRPDRTVINRLLVDPDAGVIENLLRNPKLVEADVVRLAARRPVPPEVLETVFRSRWSRRPEVQRTLVLNPYSPVDLACGLVPLLDRTAIAKVRKEANLHIAVRTTAGVILGEYESD
jgi:hypothetical protein